MSQLTVPRMLNKVPIEDLLMVFYATSVHPTAMQGEASVYFGKEPGVAFENSMNDTLVGEFNSLTLYKRGILQKSTKTQKI